MKTTRPFQLGVLICGALLALAPLLPAQGNIELGFHYGSWSVNLLKGPIESVLNDAMETEFKKKFLDKIREDHPGFEEISYSQKIRFDSGGHNFGFELRWYPAGQEGSFSLGFSVEKTSMRISLPEVSASMAVQDPFTRKGGSFAGNVHGDLVLDPLSFNLSFRWDIWPRSRIHPYFTFGLGIAGGSTYDNGKLTYGYRGDLTTPDGTTHYEDSATKTITQLKDEAQAEGGENDFSLPNFFPFVQLHFGLKGIVTENIHLLVDFGIFDGFLLRGGLAIRF